MRQQTKTWAVMDYQKFQIKLINFRELLPEFNLKVGIAKSKAIDLGYLPVFQKKKLHNLH